MRTLIVLAVLAASTRTERWARPDARDRREGRIITTTSAGSTAVPFSTFFAFAPVSMPGFTDGAGLGAACACAAVTTPDGGAITFTRASDAYCFKGSTQTGIANGDAVVCTTDQPRILPGGDGTGGLGLGMFEARTNSLLYSQEFDNAAWLLGNTGAGNPTVTANAGISPDGTMNADRIQFPATTIGQYSFVRQLNACASATAHSLEVFVRAVTTSGPVQMCTDDGTNYICATVTAVSDSWTQLLKENALTLSANRHFYIGHMGVSPQTGSSALGTIAMAAADVYVWQADCQAGATISPPILTTSAAATRAVEVASIAITLPASPTNARSLAATLVTPSGGATTSLALLLKTDTSNRNQIGWAQATSFASAVWNNVGNLSGGTKTGTIAGTPSGANRLGTCYATDTIGVCMGGVCETSGADAGVYTGATTLYLGTSSTSTTLANGVVKNVCVDITSGGCR